METMNDENEISIITLLNDSLVELREERIRLMEDEVKNKEAIDKIVAEADRHFALWRHVIQVLNALFWIEDLDNKWYSRLSK